MFPDGLRSNMILTVTVQPFHNSKECTHVPIIRNRYLVCEIKYIKFVSCGSPVVK